MRIKLSSYLKAKFYSTTYGDFIVFNTGIIKNVRGNKNLTPGLVKTALRHMQTRHPLLRSHIEHEEVAENEEDLFLCIADDNSDENLAPIELQWTEEISSRAEMIKELEEFNSKIVKFRDGGSLAQAKAIEFVDDGLKKYAISLRMLCLITDGVNIVVLLIEFVNIINALLAGEECEEMRIKLELANDMHTELSNQNIFTEQIRKEVDELCKVPVFHYRFPVKFASASQTGMKINLVRIDAATTSRLVQRSKENGVKISSALAVFEFVSMRKLFSENNIEFPLSFSFVMPVNARYRLQEPEYDFANMSHQILLASIWLDYQQNIELFEDENFWLHVKFMQSCVDKALDFKSGKLYVASHNVQGQLKTNSFFYKNLKSVGFDVTDGNVRERFGDARNCFEFGVSNIGRWVYDRKKVNEGGELSLEEVYFADSIVSAPRISYGIGYMIGFWRDEIMLMIPTNKTMIDPVYSERYVQIFEETVRIAAR